MTKVTIGMLTQAMTMMEGIPTGELLLMIMLGDQVANNRMRTKVLVNGAIVKPTILEDGERL